MRITITLITILGCYLKSTQSEEVRLLDLEPTDAQQVIEKQDQTLKYAPKIESNVPAIRFLGEEPYHVSEDIYLAKQYHGQDGLGGYLYGYSVPDIAKNEQKKPDGDLKGAYNYITGNGEEIKVEYWDDGTGFHQVDNVPKILPKQIDDSPEVKAAKDEFLKRWNEEAERNQHPVQDPYNSEGQYASGPLSAQGQLERKQFFAQQPQYQPSASQSYQGQASSQPQQSAQYPKPQVPVSTSQYQGASYNQPLSTGQYQQPQSSSSVYQQSPTHSQSESGQYQPSSSGQQQQGSYQQSGGQYQASSGQHQSSGSGQYQHGGGQSQGYGGQAVASRSAPQGSYQSPSGPSGLSTGSQSKYQTNYNQIDYSGQYSENRDVYASAKSQSGDEEETTGPPKGFFYSFDYPVGIIVQKGASARSDLKGVYEQNKAKFENQLAKRSSDNGSSATGYVYVKN